MEIGLNIKPVIRVGLGILLIFTVIQIFSFDYLEINNVYAISSWEQASYNDFKNGTLENLTIIHNGNDPELILDLGNWWVKKNPVNKPCARAYNVLAPINNDDKAILFGGRDKDDNWLNDTWVYDYSINIWTKKSPPNPPDTRSDCCMSTIYGTDKSVLYNNWIAETWIYDLNDDQWTKKYTINKPGKVSYPVITSIYNSDQVILFYSTSGLDNFCDTWIYNLSENNWTNKTPSIKPSPRSGFAIASIYGTDKILLFGGRNEDVYLDDTWIYDLSENTWTKKELSVTKPGKISGHKMAEIYNSDKIVLYGGYYTGSTWSKESWVYDFSEDNWTKKHPELDPNDRNDHAMSLIYGTDSVLLFGGWSSPGMSNETWVYKYGSTGTFTSSSYDISSNSSLKTITWESVVPPGTGIKFQLRTAKDKSDLSIKDFIGPDGTSSSYYTSSAATIWSGHNGDSRVQYKVYFNTSDINKTPSLKKVIISYNYFPKPILTNPLNDRFINNNKPAFMWNVIDNDSNQQNAFQVLIDDNKNFESINYNSGEQSSVNNQWQFPGGTSFSTIPDGVWYWKVRTQDSDGDWGPYTESWKFKIDTKKPYTTIDAPKNNEFYNNLNNISGNAYDIDDGSGIEKVEIIIKRLSDNKYWNGFNWRQAETWLLAEGINYWAYNVNSINWISGDQYNIQTRASDNATNIEVPGTGNKFFIDLDYPLSMINDPIDNAYLNNINTISGITNDTGGSGVKNIEISIMENDKNKYWDGDFWSSIETWLPVSGINIWSYDVTGVQWFTDIYYTIRSRAMDNASNMEIPGNGNIFMLDNKPPEVSIIINNGDEYTNSTFADLLINGEDTGSGISQMTFSTNKTKWTDWESFNRIKLLELTPGDGKKIVYLKVQDRAGNIINPISSSITLDTVPPTELSISLISSSPRTDFTIFTFKLNAIDDTSGISQMSFSTDGETWTSWEPFKYESSIPIPPTDNEKIIYFKVKDRAGNIAEPVTTTIQLKKPDITEGSADNEEIWYSSIIIVIIIFIILIIFSIIMITRKSSKRKSSSQDNYTEISALPPIKSKPGNQPRQSTYPPQQQYSSTAEVSVHPSQPTQLQQNLCSICQQPLTYIAQNNGYYCYRCQKYE